MASVGQPKYGIEITYKSGASTRQWFRSEAARDKRHAQLQRDPLVRRAKRVTR